MVVSGMKRKLVPNQKALSAVCCRFPNSAGLPGGAATVDIAQG